MCKCVCACTLSCQCLCACVVCMLSGLWGVVVVEGWREAAGPAGASRCGATELTGLGPSGRMCANHNLSCFAAAPSVVWLWRMQRGRGTERERLWVMKK